MHPSLQELVGSAWGDINPGNSDICHHGNTQDRAFHALHCARASRQTVGGVAVHPGSTMLIVLMDAVEFYLVPSGLLPL